MGDEARTTAPFPFLLGCVRSGTTLLRAMFDSHPRVAVPPEADFVPASIRARDRIVTSAGFDLAAFADTVRADGSLSEWMLSSTLDDVLEAARPQTLADAVRAVYAEYAREHGKPLYADKTPGMLLVLDRVVVMFPEARFVHIVRDGRDVAASIARMHFGPDRFAEAVLFWRRRVEHGCRVGRALGAERYLEVRYEDLVARPEPVLRDLCAHFGLEYSPAMLDYHRRADDLMRGLRHTEHITGIRQPPTQGRNWRHDLPARDAEVFEVLAGDLAADLGYERLGRRVSLRSRAQAGAWRVGTELERRTRATRWRIARRVSPRRAARGAAPEGAACV